MISKIASGMFPIALACAALCACGGHSGTENDRRTAKSEHADAGANASSKSAFAITAEFSASDPIKAEKDPRILRWQDGPCGASPVIKTSNMLLNDPILQPDPVVEFAPDGKILRTWGKPFNAQIGVLKGDRITFSQFSPDGKETQYWTDTQGRIGPWAPNASNATSIDSGKEIDCPTIEIFGDSAYLGCYETADIDNGQTHRIALEGPCT